MKSVKTIVKDRMRELGMKPYDLAKAVKGRMADQTIYNFVKGKAGAEMTTKNLAAVLEALGLEIRPKRRTGERTKRESD